MANYNQMQKRGENITRSEASRLVTKMLGQYTKALEVITQLVAREYNRFLKGVDPKDYHNTLAGLGRLEELQRRTRKAYNFYAQKAGIDLIESSRLSFTNNYYRQQYSKAWFSPLSKSNIILDFTLVDPIAVELSVSSRIGIFDAIENQQRKEDLKGFAPPESRKSTKQLLKTNAILGANKIGDAITQGIIMGSSLTDISRSISSSMSWSRNRAKRFARTEVHKNLNGGQYASYLDAKEQGLSDKRKIISVLDIRTRRQSAIVDERVDDKNNLFTYPRGLKVAYPGNSGVKEWDINDRETTIEIIAGIEPQLRRARNPVTGENEIVSFRSFNSWAKENNLKRDKSGKLFVDK